MQVGLIVLGRGRTVFSSSNTSGVSVEAQGVELSVGEPGGEMLRTTAVMDRLYRYKLEEVKQA